MTKDLYVDELVEDLTSYLEGAAFAAASVGHAQEDPRWHDLTEDVKALFAKVQLLRG